MQANENCLPVLLVGSAECEAHRTQLAGLESVCRVNRTHLCFWLRLRLQQESSPVLNLQSHSANLLPPRMQMYWLPLLLRGCDPSHMHPKICWVRLNIFIGRNRRLRCRGTFSKQLRLTHFLLAFDIDEGKHGFPPCNLFTIIYIMC